MTLRQRSATRPRSGSSPTCRQGSTSSNAATLTAKLAVIGFCFGGGMTWQLLAAGDPRISAAVPFYGPFPEGGDLSGSPNAAVLGIYAELDDFVNPTMEAAEAALQAAGLEHELRTFEGVDHAFFNDTGRNYDADAAAAAYTAMLDWFDRYLATVAARFDHRAGFVRSR